MLINKANKNTKQSFHTVSESYLDEKIFGNVDAKEPLLSSEMSEEVEDNTNSFDFEVDDSVFDIVKTNDNEEAEVPNTPDKFGIASMLNSLIRDEWEAIDGYNSTIATLRGLSEDGSLADVDSIIKVLSDIANEENIHVGQLQKILELVSPNATSISTGEREADEQIIDKQINTNPNALHPGMRVQSFEQPVINRTEKEANVDDVADTYCSISDIDDEF